VDKTVAVQITSAESAISDGSRVPIAREANAFFPFVRSNTNSVIKTAIYRDFVPIFLISLILLNVFEKLKRNETSGCSFFWFDTSLDSQEIFDLVLPHILPEFGEDFRPHPTPALDVSIGERQAAAL